MHATLKIAIFGLASLAAAVPSSPNADAGALFAIESYYEIVERCTGLYARCNDDCCGSLTSCNYIPICGNNRCVSYDPAITYNPTCN
ncbi:hypothetical protein CMEL01_16358 [Colletotrichum melonis]|uniref:Uncharacterized protein n=3 Tax=Colletotrichum acutatum species complex TaxID=2707335 RepID=A0AAI9YM48_9PEZI|nr:uncharacterized protein CCOS01_13517 [Colletotrichum costaricense]KAK1456680.1 hypothetical protein CMEL01_16358 [Colletotrichum melonis]KAK1477439.1 hypothetical protein CCUS01_16657 [Colletotrichum cuscutae]KAK1515324.1 hypothetical protein CCOS01_13517 [Colletotrichum costaricense]